MDCASDWKVVELMSSVWFETIVMWPALAIAASAGATKVCEPASLPKASAIFLKPLFFAIATMATASAASGGTRRKKYGNLTESNSDSPVMQNDTVLFEPKTGT